MESKVAKPVTFHLPNGTVEFRLNTSFETHFVEMVVRENRPADARVYERVYGMGSRSIDYSAVDIHNPNAFSAMLQNPSIPLKIEVYKMLGLVQAKEAVEDFPNVFYGFGVTFSNGIPSPFGKITAIKALRELSAMAYKAVMYDSQCQEEEDIF